MNHRSLFVLTVAAALAGCKAAPRHVGADITTMTCVTERDATLADEQRLDAQWVDLRVVRPQPLASVLRMLIGEEWPATERPFPRSFEDGVASVLIPTLRAENVSLREALDEVAEAGSISWCFEGGQLVFRRL